MTWSWCNHSFNFLNCNLTEFNGLQCSKDLVHFTRNYVAKTRVLEQWTRATSQNRKRLGNDITRFAQAKHSAVFSRYIYHIYMYIFLFICSTSVTWFQHKRNVHSCIPSHAKLIIFYIHTLYCKEFLISIIFQSSTVQQLITDHLNTLFKTKIFVE